MAREWVKIGQTLFRSADIVAPTDKVVGPPEK